MARPAENRDVHTIDANLVLDLQQLRDITLDDEELMREVLTALIEDTSKHLELLDSAIRAQDQERCKRLAHYCKGACANVGANAAAAVLRRIEEDASSQDYNECAGSLVALHDEMFRLRIEAESI
jgi:HPt (histidine-containing phosphotransfer) domain-containing protein